MGALAYSVELTGSIYSCNTTLDVRWICSPKPSLQGSFLSTFAQNFQFLTPPLPFSFLFFLHVPLPPSTYVCFSELPLPLSQKQFRDTYEFSNQKSGSEMRENN